MPKKPTAADAQLILQLYDLRREAEMRKARSWFAGSFFPETADDYAKVANAYSIPENAWLRQVVRRAQRGPFLRDLWRDVVHAFKGKPHSERCARQDADA
jgi:hypothetical protein